jgi:16S rRNA processing protein RimM
VSDTTDSCIEVGVIEAAYGVRGWMKVKPYALNRQRGNVLAYAKHWQLSRADQTCQMTVCNIKPYREAMLVQLAACDNREAALALVGWRISVNRADFPLPGEDEYYWVDLIGLQVINLTGVTLGVVDDLIDHGAHAILCLTSPGQKKTALVQKSEQLIPFVSAYVCEVDLAGHQIIVNWPVGG